MSLSPKPTCIWSSCRRSLSLGLFPGAACASLEILASSDVSTSCRSSFFYTSYRHHLLQDSQSLKGDAVLEYIWFVVRVRSSARPEETTYWGRSSSQWHCRVDEVLSRRFARRDFCHCCEPKTRFALLDYTRRRSSSPEGCRRTRNGSASIRRTI